ncbi:hypothetical protein DMN91_012094 [Ooceraea biroi]|uniref:FAST kinase domain-containing protein n=1 Tax=Ooceraea biroi TaxID=2015173 RepID=A0A026WDN2_OOCBI|nr:FAST kinase domain-containing protein 5, mitochondrial [Ooceraea biroi]EZA53791.1 FAST kinase domain-containing protein [Ooceraea biroi]RLU16334.1 hypothetical protein DMN91_012094 [Ooceraea biroi]
MNVFAQRLSHLRCTYSTLLRLSDKSGYLRHTFAPTKRKFGILTRLRVQHVVCTCSTPCRRFVMPIPNRRVDERNERRGLMENVKENDYAHNLFLNSTNYAKSTLQQSLTYAYVTNEEALKILKIKWDEQLMTSEEMLSMVKRLSYNIRCSNERIDSSMYENFFNMLCKQCKNLSNDSLKILMRHVVPFYNQFFNCSFYQNLCQQLDKECVARFAHSEIKININEMLLLCDIIYQIMPKSDSSYMWNAMRKLGNKPGKLDHNQLVQVLFFLNVCRKPPINMYELEYRLEQCLDELSINEMGVALLGFFKTGTRIRSTSLLRRIIKKTIATVESIDSMSLGAILKLIRYSMQLTEIPLLQELLSSLIPQVPRFKLMTLTHVAHACAKVALVNEELMDKIIKRLNSEIKTARLKDIERLVYVFANLNIDPNNSVYENVINELRTTWDTSRAREISLFSQTASRILGYLAVLNIYPIDLIKRIMMPEFISNTCNNNYRNLTREYCVLDYSLRVEVPEYDGLLLKPTTVNMLEKKYFQEFFESTLTEASRMKMLLTEVKATCEEMFNNTSDIVVSRPLPHYATPDIIICLDKWDKLMPLEEFLSQFNQGDIIHIDETNSKDLRWIALVLAHPGLLTRNTNLPVGHLAAKLRQLPKIGFTPILMSYIDWTACRTSQQKCDYIRKLIFDTPKLSNM